MVPPAQKNRSTLTLLAAACVIVMATLQFTGAEYAPGEEPRSYECAHPDHKFAHPTDVFRYITCQDSVYHIHDCPPGKKFDKSSENCT